MKQNRMSRPSAAALTLILAVAAVWTPRPAQAQSQQAANALSALNDTFTQMLSIPDGDPAVGGDISLACINMMYQEWANAYLSVLARTPGIDPSGAGPALYDFGQNVYDSERAIRIFDYMRAGLSGEIRRELSEIRPVPGTPADLVPSEVTLADLKYNLFTQNLALCSRHDFMQGVATNLREIDVTAPIPSELLRINQGTVKWIGSPQGGIQLTLGSNSGVTAPVAIVIGPGPSAPQAPMTYLEFLNNVQRHHRF